MKEHPILMSTPMIQAYMAGLKNQTRRLTGLDEINNDPDDWQFEWAEPLRNIWTMTQKSSINEESIKNRTFKQIQLKAPYGISTETILWFRESWNQLLFRYAYRADEKERDSSIRWRPSIHMRRDAARFTTKLLKYRLERLHDITEEDAINEGLEFKDFPGGRFYRTYSYNGIFDETNPIDSYRTLWDMLNSKPKPGKKPYPWDYNPWVWVVEFERYYPNN